MCEESSRLKAQSSKEEKEREHPWTFSFELSPFSSSFF
jgi:hypothetical protein